MGKINETTRILPTIPSLVLKSVRYNIFGQFFDTHINDKIQVIFDETLPPITKQVNPKQA